MDWADNKAMDQHAPIKADGKWKYGLKMKCKCAPCAQIHHAGDDHRNTSFKDDSSDTVYVADSMLGNRSEAGTSVEMQLLNIYGQDRKKIKVFLLKVQQQDNHIDRGVFAIAFRTEFCFSGLKGFLNAEFDMLKFRQHLVNCLENLELVPFPKVKRKLNLKINK